MTRAVPSGPSDARSSCRAASLNATEGAERWDAADRAAHRGARRSQRSESATSVRQPTRRAPAGQRTVQWRGRTSVARPPFVMVPKTCACSDDGRHGRAWRWRSPRWPLGCKFSSPEMKNTGAGGGWRRGRRWRRRRWWRGRPRPAEHRRLSGQGRGQRRGACSRLWNDFPAAPVIDRSAHRPTRRSCSRRPPARRPAAAVPAGAGGRLQLFPRNWLRPRFHVIPAGRPEPVRDRPARRRRVFAHDLVVYTHQPDVGPSPAAISPTGLSEHVVDARLLPSRCAARCGTASGLTTPPALGTVGANPRSCPPGQRHGRDCLLDYHQRQRHALAQGLRRRRGHRAPGAHPDPCRRGPARPSCIGCHSSTPDGSFVGFSAYDVGPDDCDPGALGTSCAALDGHRRPADVPVHPPAAQRLLARVDQNAPAFGGALAARRPRGALDVPARAAAARPRSSVPISRRPARRRAPAGASSRAPVTAAAPASAGSATTVRPLAYVSALAVDPPGAASPHGDGNLYTVPYGARAPAAPPRRSPAPATRRGTSSIPTSPRTIGCSRSRACPAPAPSYDNTSGEVFVVPATGGTPDAAGRQRSVPRACPPPTSPGVTNSWPKWSPRVDPAPTGDRTFTG